MIRVTVCFRDVLCDLAGVGSERILLEGGASVARAVAAVAARHPLLLPALPAVTVTRDNAPVGMAELLRDGDRLDLSPVRSVT